MTSAVADLEAGLQAMLNLKPPGVSGSRITSLTSLCVANVQVCFWPARRPPSTWHLDGLRRGRRSLLPWQHAIC